MFAKLHNWLGSAVRQSCGRSAAHSKNSFTPRLESLEAREVPAFLTPIKYPSGIANKSLYDVQVADFNADGAADIAVVNQDFQSGGPSTVAIILNKGDGTFPKSQTYALKFRARTIGAGDFNGDGRPDIVVAGADRVAVLVNPGTKGGWRVGQDLTLPTPAGTQYQNAGSLAVGDFDGNGRADVAVTARSNSTTSYEAQGFTHILTSAAGGKPGSVNLSVRGTVPVSPMFNKGDENWIDAPTTTWTTVGDFDKDGRQEILSGVLIGYSISSTSLTGLATDGSVRTPVALGADAGGMAVADFNHDGNLDFASGFQIQLGKGDGTFVAGGTLPAWYQNIAVGDFNRDGVTDILGGDYNGGPTAVLLGNEDGTFRSAGHAPFGAMYGLAVGDFNRDGWMDAVGVNFSYAPYGPWVSLNDKVWA